jgi:hypothetical protein
LTAIRIPQAICAFERYRQIQALRLAQSHQTFKARDFEAPFSVPGYAIYWVDLNLPSHLPTAVQRQPHSDPTMVTKAAVKSSDNTAGPGQSEPVEACGAFSFPWRVTSLQYAIELVAVRYILVDEPCKFGDLPV